MLLIYLGGSSELVECFCGGALAEGGNVAVARFVGDGVEVGLAAGDVGSFRGSSELSVGEWVLVGGCG